MALPAEVPEDRLYDQFIGAYDMDLVMTEDVAEGQRLEHPDMCYLGRGNCGVAYNVGDKVIKYTFDETEHKAALKLMENPISCTVRVFESKKVQNRFRGDAIFKIILEHVAPLTSKRDILYINDISNTLAFGWPLPEKITSTPNAERLYQDCVSLVSCLKSNGYSAKEIHGYNVGYNNDVTILFIIR